MLRTTLLLALLASVSLTSIEASAAPADDDADAAAAQRIELRRVLAEQRALNLARFHRYRVKGIYPHNTYEPGMLNVWTDADGHLCAVATLMKRAGLDELVETTAREQNFVRIADLTSGPLMDWVLASGLTQEELVMIQQPSAADVEQMEREARREARKLARKLAREDARLAKNYAVTERALEREVMTNAGLDLAVARLAQHPQLAAAVLASKQVAQK